MFSKGQEQNGFTIGWHIFERAWNPFLAYMALLSSTILPVTWLCRIERFSFYPWQHNFVFFTFTARHVQILTKFSKSKTSLLAFLGPQQDSVYLTCLPFAKLAQTQTRALCARASASSQPASPSGARQSRNFAVIFFFFSDITFLLFFFFFLLNFCQAIQLLLTRRVVIFSAQCSRDNTHEHLVVWHGAPP